MLTDAEAKKAFDDVLRAKLLREARWADQDAKRRKLREELEQREKQSYAEKSAEDKAKARLKEELARLRYVTQIFLGKHSGIISLSPVFRAIIMDFPMFCLIHNTHREQHAAQGAARFPPPPPSHSATPAPFQPVPEPDPTQGAAAVGGDSAALQEQLARTLKVQWDAGISDYT